MSIKGQSANATFKEFPELKQKYWGCHMWATGYFVTSVGAVNQDVVKHYIENQDLPEDDNFTYHDISKKYK